jgi:squalene-hopene/tetraprenyl-beta-curcumene cyclase
MPMIITPLLVILLCQGAPSGAAVGDALLAQPTTPLDARVDAKKVTSLAPPQLPRSLTPPPPVIRRIADSASQVPVDAACFERARAAIKRGLDFLRKHQGPEGGWMEGVQGQGSEAANPSKAASTAVTALVIRAFAQAGFGEDSDPAVGTGVRRLLAQTRDERGFAPDPSGGMETYVASCTALALTALDSPKHAEALQEVLAWLKRVQWDQAEGVRPEQDWFGGVGYGSKGRPDLSNTQMMLDALHDGRVKADDASVQRALAFVQRCQNRKADGAAAWAEAGSGDGGFVYTVANGGESFASEVAGEGRYGEKMPPGTRALRSYGSMTYAGYKSLLFAGLAKNDPRVLAALEWIASHYTMNENPGLGQQGLFYYRLAMARALLAGGMDSIKDSAGTAHDWRCELINALVASQQADGSWVNPQDRWMEGQPDLVTAYALLAIEEAIKPTLQSQ